MTHGPRGPGPMGHGEVWTPGIIQNILVWYWIILSPKAWERVCGSLGPLLVMFWIKYDPRCLWDPKKLSNKDLGSGILSSQVAGVMPKRCLDYNTTLNE